MSRNPLAASMRLLAAVLVGTAASAQESPLAVRLAAVVDLPTPDARRAGANELADDEEVTLEEWEEAARGFAPRGPSPMTLMHPMKHEHMFELDVDLTVLGEQEQTELGLYMPPSYDADTPHGLLVLLHGTGNGGPSMLYDLPDWAASLGLLILAPSEAGRNRGFNGEPREKASVLEALRWMRRTYNVDENRIHVAGMSRGGMLTWDLALRYPDHFASAVPMAGGPRYIVDRGINNLRYAGQLAHMSLRQFIGEKESPTTLMLIREAFSRLERESAADAVLLVQEGLGHEVRMEELDFPKFFSESQRDPRPGHVVRLFAHEGENRAFWVEILSGHARRVQEVWIPRAPAGTVGEPRDEDILKWIMQQADERTARAEATFEQPGRITLTTHNVKKLRLLFSRDMLGEKNKVEITLDGKKRTRRLRPSKRVLLRDFVERFDRTFLPVANSEL